MDALPTWILVFQLQRGGEFHEVGPFATADECLAYGQDWWARNREWARKNRKRPSSGFLCWEVDAKASPKRE